VNGGGTWTKQNDYNDRPFYYSQVRVDPRNSDRLFFSSSSVQLSLDGGKTSRLAQQGAHTDTHGIWIDPNDPGRMAFAHDGGIAVSFDGGGSFFSPMNLPLTQFYSVGLDNAVPYNVCGGSQDNGGFCGPSRRQSGPLSNAYWSSVAGGDVGYVVPDPSSPNHVYTEAVSGNLSRVNLASGERVQVRKPNWEAIYQKWEDSIATLRGDPLKPPARDVAAAIAALRTKQRQDSIDLDIRFGWEAAVLTSKHNPSTLYWGGSRVLKSTDRGEHMTLISPDLTKKLYAKIDTSMHLTGGVSLETTQTELFGYTTALAESFVKPGLLYAARMTATSGRRTTTAEVGRISHRGSPACRMAKHTSRESTPRTSTRSRSTSRSTTTATTTTSHTSTRRTMAERRSARSLRICPLMDQRITCT
jgi:hypothetical protein